MSLPDSTFLNEETRDALERARGIQGDKTSYHLERMRDRYDVAVTSEHMGGVYTEVFTPRQGIPSENKRRVLINLHGGAFQFGSRTSSHVESIPIAWVGRFKVISIDYRMAPEHRFPAASEDVGAVYRELLETHDSRSIGVYGCSAGGLLTAQSVAWLLNEGLPLPGAVGMFCAGGSYYAEGDSGHITSAAFGARPVHLEDSRHHPYFKDTDPYDPLAFPVRSAEMMAKFPPSQLISSTRDLALSSVVHAHSRLVALGVEAELHVWEGLGHGFFYDPDLPQSREVYEVAARFFDRRLAKGTEGRQ